MRSRTVIFKHIVVCLVLSCTNSYANSLGEPGRNSSHKNPLKNVYFEEQNIHTVNTPDAFAFGTRNTPDDAYRFCKGEPIKIATTCETVKKRTPYGQCAVTDHAEYMGIMPLLLKKDNPLTKTEIGKLIANGDPKKGETAFQQIISPASYNQPITYINDPMVMLSIWEQQKQIANKHYEPSKFTTLIAFEWTAIPQYQNPHLTPTMDASSA